MMTKAEIHVRQADDLRARDRGYLFGRRLGVDPREGRLDRPALPGLAFQRALQGTLAGDVPIGLHVGDHPARGIADPRDDGGDFEVGPVHAPVDDRALPCPTRGGGGPDVDEERRVLSAAVDDPRVAADDRLGRVAVRAGERRVDVRDHVVQVLHPDRVGGLLDRGHETGPLLVRGHGVGDVLGRPDEPDRLAAVITDDLGLLVDDPDRSVGLHDPVIGRYGRYVRARGHTSHHLGAVVRVDELLKRLLGPFERARLHPEDAARLVGPPQCASREFQVPAADVGGPLGLVEVELAHPERLDEAKPLGLEAHEGGVGGARLGPEGAVSHTGFAGHGPSVTRVCGADQYPKVRRPSGGRAQSGSFWSAKASIARGWSAWRIVGSSGGSGAAPTIAPKGPAG